MDNFSALLYGKLRSDPKTVAPTNLVCSPLSVRVVLEMLAAGAKGDTAQAFEDVLKLAPLLPKDLDPNKIMISNAAFVHHWVKLDPNYRAILVDEFKARLARIAPNTSRFALCDEINGWVEERTKGMIKQLVLPSDLTANALMFVNAVWFKDRWDSVFDPVHTHKTAFWLNPDNHIDVPFMNQTQNVLYADVGVAQMVKLLYVGPFAMYVILPKDFEATENALIDLQFEKWARQMRVREVALSMPKFSLESTISLERALQQLGLGIIFDEWKADFSGMYATEGVPNLWVERVLQKAKIEVGEKGTEAAAATYTGFSGCAGYPDPRIPFRVDRPFMFVLQHKPTATTLFMGRVMNPKGAM